MQENINTLNLTNLLPDFSCWQTMAELTADVDSYIEFYSHRRFHETLKYKNC